MLGEYTPDNSVLTALTDFERARQQRQYDLGTSAAATEARQWADWIARLKGWLPLLDQWANDAVIGAKARAVRNQVNNEINRSILAYNAAVAAVNAVYGQITGYGGVSVGVNTVKF